MSSNLIDEILKNEQYLKDNIDKLNELVSKKTLEFNDYNYMVGRINRYSYIIDSANLSLETEGTLQKLNEFYTDVRTNVEHIFELLHEENYDLQSSINSIVVRINGIEDLFNKIYNIPLFSGNSANVSRSIRQFKGEVTKVTNRVESLSKNLESRFVEIDAITKAKIEELNAEANDKFDSINDLQTSMQNDIDTRFTEFDNRVASKESELDDIKNSYEGMYKELESNIKEKFNQLSEEMNTKNDEISKLIGLIGNKTKIGDYKSNADKARTERIIWQIVTVSIFLFSFVWMFITTLKTKDYNVSTLVRLAVGLALLSMSGYTGRQASNQRKDEVYYRKQQLELLSIDVYLDSIPETDRIEIKRNLSNKIFGQAAETYKNKYDDTTNEVLDKIFKMIENISVIVSKK